MLLSSAYTSGSASGGTSNGQDGGSRKDDDTLPEWLDELKKNLLSTGQWGALVREVYNGVAQRLGKRERERRETEREREKK